MNNQVSMRINESRINSLISNTKIGNLIWIKIDDDIYRSTLRVNNKDNCYLYLSAIKVTNDKNNDIYHLKFVDTDGITMDDTEETGPTSPLADLFNLAEKNYLEKEEKRKESFFHALDKALQ